MAVFDLKNGEVTVVEMFGDATPDTLRDLTGLPLQFN
jgi:3-oxoadipate CoA-transferase beta subunit